MASLFSHFGFAVLILSQCFVWAANESLGFNSGVPGGTGGRSNWDQAQQQGQFRPFGSDRPCSALVNETLNQNDAQVIVERILIQSDTMGNSFSSSSFVGGSNQQLDTWAAQACGQMQNIVGYLKTACQFSMSASSISSVQSTSSTEMVAQKKLNAMNAMKDYLCSNNQVNLKEMAMNNGAQCARKTDLKEFGCDIQQGSQPTFIQMLPTPNRQTLKYGTSIILSMLSYNGDDCKYLADVTNCLIDKYNRGTDFCSSRASTHFNRIFDVMLQGVQCKTGGYSTFNTFDTSNSFNNNPAFNRFPSNNFPSSNSQNTFGSSNNFGQNPNFPQGSNNFGQSNFGMNSGSNWPQNQNQFGNNWPQNQNQFGSSGSNWPQNSNSFGQSSGSFGQSSGSFGQSSNNFGQNSGFDNGGTIPPYNPQRRPYYNSGSATQAVMAMVVTTLFASVLAI